MPTPTPKAEATRGAAKSFVATPDAPAVALLAMRVASIIRRSDQDPTFKLAPADRSDIQRAREALLGGVAATQRVAIPGPGRQTRQLTSMGLIFGAVTKAQRVNTASLVESLTRFANDLESLVVRRPLHDAEGLLGYYERLAAEARRMVSSGGERVVRRSR